MPDDMKFFVFKIKQRAKQNYYEITTDSRDDDRFKFNFKGEGQQEVVPEYSYNWPYDYCSLVENASVSLELEFEKLKEEE